MKAIINILLFIAMMAVSNAWAWAVIWLCKEWGYPTILAVPFVIMNFSIYGYLIVVRATS